MQKGKILVNSLSFAYPALKFCGKKKQAKKLKAAKKEGYNPKTGLYVLKKADKIKTAKKIKPYKSKKAKK